MTTEKTEAIVIRQADFSETSRVMTFFTRDWGKVSAVAKGARRLKGPFEVALDLLVRSRIVFIRKSSSSLDILTEAQLISRFTPNRRNLTGLYAGYYLAELLAGLTEEYDPHPVLYDHCVRTLERLAEADEPRKDLLRFELVLLREIGQLPAFDECQVCGRPLADNGPFVFWVSQGGLICRRCQKEDYSQNQIHSGTLGALRQLAGDSDRLAERLALSDTQHRQIRGLVTSAVSHALGRRPKMLAYLK